jgi:hypothetical protein
VGFLPAEVTAAPAWSYEVEPDGEGTLLTDSHEVTRPGGRIELVNRQFVLRMI